MVAIHQPNFFPWLGYFDKIIRSDAFVFLDDVQIQKTGASWSNRVKMMVAEEPRWVTAPIQRDYSGLCEVREINFLDTGFWQKKLIKTLKANYGRHPFYEETIHVLEPLVTYTDLNLSNFNIHSIITIADRLGIKRDKFKKSSDFDIGLTSNELLVSLTKIAGGNIYLSGGGSGAYQDDELFKKNGLLVEYQSFKHPVYRQKTHKVFHGGLSIVDALMNVGFDGVKELLGGS